MNICSAILGAVLLASCGVNRKSECNSETSATKVPAAASAEYERYCLAITGKKAPKASFAIDRALDAVHDEYRIVTDGEGVAFTGANARAVMYAVYDFLERRGGCRWFWDGDIVPKKDSIDCSDLDVREKSRYEYRAIRYFAHRGLTRFQAEHWGFDEWKKELDWCLKKRLNTFMLRIGQDDVFQRAFPDVCPYPDPSKPLVGRGKDYNNRSLFWSLEYRGKLREMVMSYAAERGLMSPEDCGSMTHWYSRTPVEFLEKMKPDFVKQSSSAYSENTGLVWDIRKQKWLDAYWKLTETAIAQYDGGHAPILHVMGLGERRLSTDPAENFAKKSEIDRKVLAEAKMRHPESVAIIPGWDFYATWTPEEVRRHFSMLDRDRTLLWDYEADAYRPDRGNFTEWGVVGKFPYTFGIFLAYESALDVRANYDLIRARQKVAEVDPFCKGYLLWPESSHTDALAIDYFTRNAWNPCDIPTERLIAEFCTDRYGNQVSDFERIWRDVVPISTNCLYETWRSNYGLVLFQLLAEKYDIANNDPDRWPKTDRGVFAAAPAVFGNLAKIDVSDAFALRDVMDLARTVGDRLALAAENGMMGAYFRWKAGDASAPADFERYVAEAREFASLMARLLTQHTDYSLNDSLERLNAVEKVRNPDFGQILMENAVNGYCASHQAEAAEHLYPKVIDAVAEDIRKRMKRGDKEPLSHRLAEGLRQEFLKRPLVSLKSTTPRTPEKLREVLDDFAAAARKFLMPMAMATDKAVVITAKNVEIVVPPGSPQVVRFAAEELKTLLGEVLGGTVPVVNGPSSGRNSIILGLNKYSAAVGISTNDLVRDAFVLKTKPGRIYIVGRDSAKANPKRDMGRGVWANMYERATLFGVYEFLERYAGVRFYFPGELGTVVPKKDQVAVPQIDFVVAPDWTVRNTGIGSGTWFEGEDRDNHKNPIRFLNHYRLRLQTRYRPFCHGQVKLHLLERFGKTHPEYFWLRPDGTRQLEQGLRMGGQLCHSSGVWEEIYQDAKSYLRGEPATVRGVLTRAGKPGWEYSFQENTFFDVMPQDGMRQCMCEKCQAAYRKDDPANFATELLWGNVKKAAERLTAEGVHGYLTMMAYRPYRRIPDFDLPTNVLVMVAERGPWSMQEPKNLERDNKEIAAWRYKQGGNRVATWTYPLKYGKTKIPIIPYSTPRTIGAYYKTCAKDIYGSYMESDTDRAYTAFLPHYVFAKFAWNNQVDVKALLDEHYQLMYGAAASEMQRYSEEIEDKWLYEILGKSVDTDIGPTWAPVSEKEIWTKVYSPAVLSRYAKLFDSARAKVPEGSLEARRIALMRRETLELMEKECKAYTDRLEAVKSIRFVLNRTPNAFFTLSPFALGRAPATKNPVKTEVRAWEESGRLKFLVRCEEPQMQLRRVKKRQSDVSSVWQDDNVEIMLNPSGDRDVFYHFFVNSAGSMSDMKQVAHAHGKEAGDFGWNSNADVMVTHGDGFWTAELSIPLANLPGLDSQSFPAEVVRCRRLNDGLEEFYHWSPYTRTPLDVTNFGMLVR